MNRPRAHSLGGAAALAVLAGSTQAIVFGPGLNDVDFDNREIIYRSIANCTVGTCLPSVAGGNAPPPGYRQVNNGVPGNVLVGDVVVGIFAATKVVNQGSTTSIPQGTVWTDDNNASGGFDTFSGYFAKEVVAVQPNVSGAIDRLIFGTATSPAFHIGGGSTFSHLGAGEIARAWTDTVASPYALDASTLAASIATVTDGISWGGFSIGVPAVPGTTDLDGYSYTLLDIDGAFSGGTFFNAWNIAFRGPAFNLIGVKPINDPDESFAGGGFGGDPATTAAINFAGSCTSFASSTFACSDFTADGTLFLNTTAGSAWPFASTDPPQLFQAPEPGTIALLAISLAALRFRRRIAGRCPDLCERQSPPVPA